MPRLATRIAGRAAEVKALGRGLVAEEESFAVHEAAGERVTAGTGQPMPTGRAENHPAPQAGLGLKSAARTLHPAGSVTRGGADPPQAAGRDDAPGAEQCH